MSSVQEKRKEQREKDLKEAAEQFKKFSEAQVSGQGISKAEFEKKKKQAGAAALAASGFAEIGNEVVRISEAKSRVKQFEDSRKEQLKQQVLKEQQRQALSGLLPMNQEEELTPAQRFAIEERGARITEEGKITFGPKKEEVIEELAEKGFEDPETNDNDTLEFTKTKSPDFTSRALSPREIAEGITKGEIEKQEIGFIDPLNVLKSTTSGEFAKKPVKQKTFDPFKGVQSKPLKAEEQGPGVPKLAAVGGSVGSPIPFISEQERKDPKKPDPLGISKGLEDSLNFLKAEGKKRKDPVSQFAIGAGEEIVSTAAFFENLGRQTGAAIQKKPVSRLIPLPQTAPSELFSGPVEGTIDAFESGRPADFFEGIEKGLDRTGKLIEQQGIARTAGQFAPIVAPVGPKVPLKLTPVKITTAKGTQTLSRSLTLGSKPIVSKVGKNIVTGSPVKRLEKSILKDIEPKGRGFEFGTETKLGQSVLTSEKSLDILEQAGKITKTDRDFLKDLQRASEIIGKTQGKVKDRAKVKTIPEQISKALKPGKESQVLTEGTIPKLPPIKGTAAEIVQIEQKPFLPRGAGLQTSDIDVDFAGKVLGQLRAQRIAEKAVRDLRKVADPNRQFERKGTKAFAGTKGQPKEKFLELLTEKDADQTASSLSKNFEQVFGAPLGKQVVKIKTPGGKTGKFITLESQTLRRIASVGSLQGPKTEKFVAKGPVDFLRPGASLAERRIGPPEFRLKDLARLPDNFLQIAANIEKVGAKQQAKELREIAKRTKERFPEIDFQKIVSEPIEFVDIPSLSSRVASSASQTKPIAPELTKLISPKEKTSQPSIQNLVSFKTPGVSRISSGKASKSSIDSLIDKSLGFASTPSVTSKPSKQSKASKSSSGLSASTLSIGKSVTSLSKPSVVRSPISITTPSPSSPSKPSKSKPSILRPSKPSPSRTSIIIPTTVTPPPVITPKLLLALEQDTKKRKRTLDDSLRRLYVVDTPDPLRAGVLSPPGIKQLVGKTSKVFSIQDKKLAKARIAPGAFDPLGGFNFKGKKGKRKGPSGFNPSANIRIKIPKYI